MLLRLAGEWLLPKKKVCYKDVSIQIESKEKYNQYNLILFTQLFHNFQKRCLEDAPANRGQHLKFSTISWLWPVAGPGCWAKMEHLKMA